MAGCWVPSSKCSPLLQRNTLIQLISYKRYLFNGVYLSIPKGTGSCGYLFHEIPGICIPRYATP